MSLFSLCLSGILDHPGGSDFKLLNVDGLRATARTCLILATATALNTYAVGLVTLTVCRGCRVTL